MSQELGSGWGDADASPGIGITLISRKLFFVFGGKEVSSLIPSPLYLASEEHFCLLWFLSWEAKT